MRRALQILTIVLMFCGLPEVTFGQTAQTRAFAQEQQVPETYVLSAAYPNPFNPATTFSLLVRQRQHVKVEVYNMLGQPVRLLYNGTMEAGETRVFTFDAADLPTGIYLYRVQAERFTAARQVTLLK
jgi:hypothetical protein